MIIAVLIVLGICLGSFVNALVWRVHEQATEQDKKKPNKKYLQELSISKGRSMCPDCKHTLAAKDLLPILSWVSTGGKCRYCRKPISAQYPVVELATAVLFVLSYVWWPNELHGIEVASFAIWLPVLVGLMALLVYDARWYLLPNRIMLPIGTLAAMFAALNIIGSDDPLKASVQLVLAVAVGGGLFYILFQVSNGKWIGGGDVKLGWLFGLLVATPAKSLLVIFLASFLGVAISVPLMASKRLKSSSVIPFGPFLIIATFITLLFGTDILDWYQRMFLL